MKPTHYHIPSGMMSCVLARLGPVPATLEADHETPWATFSNFQLAKLLAAMVDQQTQFNRSRLRPEEPLFASGEAEPESGRGFSSSPHRAHFTRLSLGHLPTV